MRTLFLNPPSFDGFDGGAGARYQARREVRSFWFPTWLAFPAGLIEESRLIDAPPRGLTLEQVIREARGYELIVIYATTPTIRSDIQVAERLKECYPGVVVGLVGPHVMVRPTETLHLSKAVDFVTTGEFDHTIPEIAGGVPLGKVAGVAFRAGGVIRRTRDRELVRDLDALPFVTEVYARDLRIEDYYSGYLRHPYLSIYTGRGCRSRCTFCLWPQTIGGHVYRVRSPENVYREIARAREIFPQVREFFFDDDTLTQDPGHAERIARRVGRLGIRWSCNSRANVRPETLRVMKENGLRILVVGFESGNQKILDNVRKGIRLSDARRFVRYATEMGILIHGTFILGLPGETPETIEETIRFAQEIEPHSLQVSLAAPYPGTELYRQALENGWLTHPDDSFVQSGIQKSSLSYEGLSEEAIFEAVERFYKRFYFRPKAVLRTLKEMFQDRDLFAQRIGQAVDFFTFLARRKKIAGQGGAGRPNGSGRCSTSE